MEITNEYLYEAFKEFSPRAIEVFDKGWSEDKKYIMTDEDGQKFLIRLSDIKKKERAVRQVDIIKQVMAKGIPTQELISQGPCLNDTYYYILLSWIDADDAESKILQRTNSEQYEFGRVAGNYLKEIHNTSKTIQPKDDWDVLFNQKIDKKLKMYVESELKYENDDRLIEVVSRLREKLKPVQQVIHHGDYHLGNMLIDSNDTLHIIDFDRHDIADPWEEFNRLPFCYDVSPHFATGLVDSYFDDKIPEEFWEMLCLYIATNALSALPWAIPYGDVEIATMRRQTASVYKQYKHFSTVIPSWYRG